MASAKAWYWLGLGILALSLMTSGTGRSAMDQAASYVSCVRVRALPYLGAIEMAFGRTQSGYDHLQASMERTSAQKEAERARVEAARARVEAVQEMWQDRHMQAQMTKAQVVLNHRMWMDRGVLADQVMVPSVEVSTGTRHVIICPQTGVRVEVPNVRVHVPDVHIAGAPIAEPI